MALLGFRWRVMAALGGAVIGGCGEPPIDDCVNPRGCGEPQGADHTEPFDYVLRFARNQWGQPSSGCDSELCSGLKASIDAARSSIDFALYGVRGQWDIIDALVDAQDRGVRVRGVVDSENQYCGEWGSYFYPDTPALIEALGEGAVVCDNASDEYDAIMHAKFFVFDAAGVWTGSSNVSDHETGGENHADGVAVFSSRQLADIYTMEFEEMFRGRFHGEKHDDTPHVLGPDHWSDGSTRVESYFAPSDDAVTHAILPLIEGAADTLDVTSFVLTHDAIGDALVAANDRNVRVRVILDGDGATSTGSEIEKLCAAGILLKLEDWPSKQHGKWAVADGRAVVFGSQNWTAAGNERNDENTLYVENDEFAAEFSAEFSRQWADLAGVGVCGG